MYVVKRCRINDKIEIEKYYDGRFGAPGMPREHKRKATPEEMAKHNHWRKCRELRRILELNFKGGDMYLTLTCRTEERPSLEGAPKVIRQFRDRLAREYKKRGWEFKYVITCEVGSRGAVHWHMILNNMQEGNASSWDMVRKHWTRGRPFMEPLDEDRDYKKLAEYIVKETTKRIEKEQTKEKLSYIASRNLARPKEQKKKVRAKSWKRIPVPPAGYHLKEDSLVNGINKFTGLPYQKYTLLKNDELVGVQKRRGGRGGGT